MSTSAVLFLPSFSLFALQLKHSRSILVDWIDVLEVEGVYYGITSVELLRAICMELSQVGSFLDSIEHNC
ncbi:hypothetical protein C3L33_06475, partial [Rhododendron williamsianum]